LHEQLVMAYSPNMPPMISLLTQGRRAPLIRVGRFPPGLSSSVQVPVGAVYVRKFYQLFQAQAVQGVTFLCNEEDLPQFMISHVLRSADWNKESLFWTVTLKATLI